MQHQQFIFDKTDEYLALHDIIQKNGEMFDQLNTSPFVNVDIGQLESYSLNELELLFKVFNDNGEALARLHRRHEFVLQKIENLEYTNRRISRLIYNIADTRRNLSIPPNDINPFHTPFTSNSCPFTSTPHKIPPVDNSFEPDTSEHQSITTDRYTFDEPNHVNFMSDANESPIHNLFDVPSTPKQQPSEEMGEDTPLYNLSDKSPLSNSNLYSEKDLPTRRSSFFDSQSDDTIVSQFSFSETKPNIKNKKTVKTHTKSTTSKEPQSSPQHSDTPTKPKRKRRTKAEMQMDKNTNKKLQRFVIPHSKSDQKSNEKT
ncbi:hypothetical protein QTN25_005060 [Entamoeba marina]